MPKAGLRPYSTIEEGLDQYLGYNFNRIENIFEKNRDAIGGSVTVTGTVTVKTGLAFVDNCVACLGSAPSSGACFVRANPGSAAGTVEVTVYANTFAVSTLAVLVRLVAVGELFLS